MKYFILILLFLTSCSVNFNSSDVKDNMKDCFDSGGVEYSYDEALGSHCVYRSNSCQLETK